MIRKITTSFIKKVYVLFAFGIVFKYFYIVANGLNKETVASINQPAEVSINQNINSVIAIAVVFSFFFLNKKLKYSIRSIH
jgi:Sec-independent protein secretion pathway component TatC